MRASSNHYMSPNTTSILSSRTRNRGSLHLTTRLTHPTPINPKIIAKQYGNQDTNPSLITVSQKQQETSSQFQQSPPRPSSKHLRPNNKHHTRASQQGAVDGADVRVNLSFALITRTISLITNISRINHNPLYNTIIATTIVLSPVQPVLNLGSSGGLARTHHRGLCSRVYRGTLD